MVKIDDDQFADLYGLTEYVKDFSQAKKSGNFLLCASKKNSPVIRDNSKWIVSYDDIPASSPIYPDYCQGSFYILTPETAANIAEASKHVKFLWIDDVWVTGYIRSYLTISIKVSLEKYSL